MTKDGDADDNRALHSWKTETNFRRKTDGKSHFQDPHEALYPIGQPYDLPFLLIPD